MALAFLSFRGDDLPSYASVVEANTALASVVAVDAAWQAATEERRTQLLIAATREIDEHEFKGVLNPTSRQFGTQFPRDDEAKVPDEIVEATILLAGRKAALPPTLTLTQPRRASLQAGRVRQAFFNASGGPSEALVALDARIESLLAPFLPTEESAAIRQPDSITTFSDSRDLA